MALFLLSLGAVDALAPVLVIIVLIGAAAGITRGFSFLDLFGISTLANIMGRKTKASFAKGTFSKDIVQAPFGGPRGGKKFSVPLNKGAAQIGGAQAPKGGKKATKFSPVKNLLMPSPVVSGIPGYLFTKSKATGTNVKTAYSRTKQARKAAGKRVSTAYKSAPGMFVNRRGRAAFSEAYNKASKTTATAAGKMAYDRATRIAKSPHPAKLATRYARRAIYKSGFRRPGFTERVVRRGVHQTKQKVAQKAGEYHAGYVNYAKRNATPPKLKPHQRVTLNQIRQRSPAKSSASPSPPPYLEPPPATPLAAAAVTAGAAVAGAPKPDWKNYEAYFQGSDGIATPQAPGISTQEMVGALCASKENFENLYAGKQFIQFGSPTTGDAEGGFKVHIRVSDSDYEKFAMEYLPSLAQQAEKNKIDFKIVGSKGEKAFSVDNCLEQAEAGGREVSSQVGKMITIYVPENKSELVADIVNNAEKAAQRIKPKSTLQELRDKGVKDPNSVMKEVLLGQSNIVSVRWSSDFYGRDHALDVKERKADAADVINADPKRKQMFDSIKNKIK